MGRVGEGRGGLGRVGKGRGGLGRVGEGWGGGREGGREDITFLECWVIIAARYSYTMGIYLPMCSSKRSTDVNSRAWQAKFNTA